MCRTLVLGAWAYFVGRIRYGGKCCRQVDIIILRFTAIKYFLLTRRKPLSVSLSSSLLLVRKNAVELVNNLLWAFSWEVT